MRSKETTTPPSTGTAAPDSPVPEPRAVSGIPSSAAAVTTAATSAVEPGRTTAAGRTGATVSDSSWHRSSPTASPWSTCAAPTRPARRSPIVTVSGAARMDLPSSDVPRLR